MSIEGHYKKQIEGVSRLLDASEIKEFFQGLKYKTPVKWVIGTEVDHNGEHIHFVIETDHRDHNKDRFRKAAKDFIEHKGKTPYKNVGKVKVVNYCNGHFNIDYVDDIDKMISYCLKDMNRWSEMNGTTNKYKSYGYSIEYLKERWKSSYKKSIVMTKAVEKLREDCKIRKVSLADYGFEYLKLREKFKKPDPNWKKEIDRYRIYNTTDEEKKLLISNYISQIEAWDN